MVGDCFERCYCMLGLALRSGAGIARCFGSLCCKENTPATQFECMKYEV